MRISSVVLTGVLVGVLLTAPLMALLYLADQVAGLPFAPYDVFDWLTRNLPGDVITRGIDAMVRVINSLDLGETSSAAKTLETLSAWALFWGGGAAASTVFFVVRSRIGGDLRQWPGVVLGAMMALPVILISQQVNVTAATSDPVSAAWLGITVLGWGLAVDWAYHQVIRLPAKESAAMVSASQEEMVSAAQLNRREFLIRMGGATATLTVVGAGLARYLQYRDDQEYKRLIEKRRAAVIPEGLPNQDAILEPAPGTRPEYTPLEDHYRIDINVRPPEMDGSAWRLNIGGLVDNPLELTIDEIRDNYAPLNQYVTLACISNPIAGDLTSTTRWTGVSLREVLADARLQPDAHFLKITSEDGFYETVALDLVQSEPRIMLTYAWDGIALLPKHGFPLRIYIPDRYGMKQPKWITNIEAIAEDEDGYWVDRGWDKVAQMRATTVIDVVAADSAYTGDDGRMYVPIGGIAHAGARGISKVEVRIDEGDWVEAALREPLSDTTWVVWRYDWPFDAGRHSFEVRCYEGDGTPQIAERHTPHPSGATGLHEATREL